MQVWPAIDLRGGRCVRLQQGDYQRETVFGDDPVETAGRWVEAGARRLHLVDLDGARSGDPVNRPVIAEIARSLKIPCQVGGGIRDDAVIEAFLELGVERLVVGTQAIKQPEWFRRACRRLPGRLVLGLDARDGRVATDGWLETSDVSATELAATFAEEPLAAVVYTDIARDGMLSGPNIPAMRAMKEALPLPVIASGGVATVNDLAALDAAGLDGCIVGRALYEGNFTLAEALQEAGDR